MVVVDLHDRLVRRDAGVVREGRADHDQQVRLVHQPARHRRTAASEHTGTERMGVGYEALGLEGGQHRRVQTLGQLTHFVLRAARAVADDEHRPPGVADQRRRPGQSVLVGPDPSPGQPAH
jgi:hypothetical protein